MLHPCTVVLSAVLEPTRQYYMLQCTLSRIEDVTTKNIYYPELFSGTPCGDACAATDLEGIGTGLSSDQNILYSDENAQNTVSAIVTYQHCRCKVKAKIISLFCDCTLWEALRAARDGRPSPLYTEFEARLQKSRTEVKAVRNRVKALQQLAVHELFVLCNTSQCPSNNLLSSLTLEVGQAHGASHG